MNRRKIRLEKLEALIVQEGSAAKVADRIDSAPSVLSQIRSRKYPNKNIGEAMAEKLEKAYGKPYGWMDECNSEKVAEKSITDAGFKVTYKAIDITDIGWLKRSRATFIVTCASSDLNVYVEIHKKLRLGTPVNYEDAKGFVYICEEQVERAGEILTKHFHKWLSRNVSHIEKLDDTIQYRIPVLDCIQATSFPDINYEQISYERVTSEFKDCISIQVSNDSMLPSLSKGMIAYVRPQPEANTGDIVLVQIKGERESRIKRLYKDCGEIYLVPSNSRYDTIKIESEHQLNIIGIVCSGIMKMDV